MSYTRIKRIEKIVSEMQLDISQRKIAEAFREILATDIPPGKTMEEAIDESLERLGQLLEKHG